MNRRTAVIAGLAAAALAVSGCATAEQEAPEQQSEGPVTIRFQSLAFQEPTIEATQAIVDSWNEENPDIQVEYVQGSWDSVQDQLVTQFQGGTAPDVIQYESAAMTQFAQQGYLADLTGTFSDEVTDAVPAEIWDTVTVDDQLIAAPTIMQSYLVFANRTMLEDAGVEVPSGDTMTWEQLRAAAQATTDGDTYGLGWGLNDPTAAMMSLGLTFDAGYFEGSGDDAGIEVGDAELALPELVHQMAYEDESLAPVTLTQAGSDVMSGFLRGRFAMTVQGSFNAQTLTESAPAGFDWVALPPLEGTSAAQAANPQTLSVSAQSPAIEQSAAFVDYFMQAQNLSEVARGDWLIPSSSTASELLAEQTGGENGWEQILASGQNLTEAPFQAATGYPQWKDQYATPAFQQYLGDEISLDELATELTDGWSEVTG